ncbi:MAG: RMD1 family protein [Bacteroidota bacterium]
METIRLIAINIADNIDIRQLKQTFTGKLITSTSSELFYKTAENKFISIFNYGLIAFSNHSRQEIDQVILDIEKHLQYHQDKISETISIEFTSSQGLSYENEVLTVPSEYNCNELFRIVLFDLSQTVAIDYYSNIAEKLLQEVKSLSSELERKGKISLVKRDMMRFIGKSLNTKNKIVDNLYIFDSPDIAWDNEMVEKVHKILIRTFDLNARFKELEYTFKIIDDNLQIFKETYEHRYSAILEIVVIILILIEVLKSLGEKFRFF